MPCPVMLDQPFQAARLVEAGVACKPLPFRQISAEVRAQTTSETAFAVVVLLLSLLTIAILHLRQ